MPHPHPTNFCLADARCIPAWHTLAGRPSLDTLVTEHNATSTAADGREDFDSPRDRRQRQTHAWCVAAFGDHDARSIAQRGLRLAEEAIETAQACGCDAAMLHRLVDHVYAKPVGELDQELGGLGVTLLALAQAAGLSADRAEHRELERVMAKPLEHFAARNEAKKSAGFHVECEGRETPNAG